ncbi:MAG TPA: UGSC family (seleno)protein, partial [Acidimicrobiia bacterium]|nr:UGSC family (seleno)protein [Acidimicrobiia bacterium]
MSTAIDGDVRIYLDPTSERTAIARTLADRPASLEGKVVGLIDISKPRGDVFLDRLETLLTGQGLRTVRFRKPTFTKVAPVDLRHEISTKCDVIVEA